MTTDHSLYQDVLFFTRVFSTPTTHMCTTAVYDPKDCYGHLFWLPNVLKGHGHMTHRNFPSFPSRQYFHYFLPIVHRDFPKDFSTMLHIYIYSYFLFYYRSNSVTTKIKNSCIHFNPPFNMCGIRRRNILTASWHKALYHQSVRPTCLMYHRYPYGSSAEYLEECIHGNGRGHLTNACVWGYRGATKKRIRSVLNKRFISFQTAKCEGSIVTAKQTHWRSVIVDCWSLIVDCWLLIIDC